MSNELTLKARLEHPDTKQKFINLYAGVNKVAPKDAEQMLEVEKFSFMKMLSDKGIQVDSDISVLGVFLDVISNGLSFSSMLNHVYVMTRSVKVQATGQYEKRLYYTTQPDGKIFQAQRSGEISRMSKPVIVYDGDLFSIKTNDRGEEIIVYEKAVPRKSNTIIAGFVHTVYKDGRREPYWMEIEDIERLKGYSARQNTKTGANALYTSNGGQIDPGFFGAKIISFALKNVRKTTKPGQYEVTGDVADQIAAGALPDPEITGEFQPTMVITPVNEPVQQPEPEQNNDSVNDINSPF